ncbi:MAG: TlpA family protein disulfide reductase [Treponema sp.]|nr:TlpA family protein disulfide reductase [Treponema sp.]
MKKYFIFAAVFILFSGSVRAQNTFSHDMVKAFNDAGLPLLSQKVAPRDFSLPLAVPGTLGKMQSLAQLKGKVVFLNFWATWCGPCRAEMPSMEALHSRYKDKGLEILAVNSGEKLDQVLGFMKTNKLTFPAALDADGKVSGTYGIQAIPTTYLIDRDGYIIARMTGSINWDTPKMRTALEYLLK